MFRDEKPWLALGCFSVLMLVIAVVPAAIVPWIAGLTAGAAPAGWLGTLLLERVGPAWLTLIAAALMMLGAIPMHCAGMRPGRNAPVRRWCWVVSAGMNALSGALAVAAFHLHTQRPAELLPLLTGLLPGLILLTLSALALSVFSAAKKPLLILLAVADAALIVVQFVHPAGSWAAVFGLLAALCGLLTLALNVGHKDRLLLRDVSFGSFGAAMLIGFVVLVVLTEGDVLDGLDTGVDWPGHDGSARAARRKAR